MLLVAPGLTTRNKKLLGTKEPWAASASLELLRPGSSEVLERPRAQTLVSALKMNY